MEAPEQIINGDLLRINSYPTTFMWHELACDPIRLHSGYYLGMLLTTLKLDRFVASQCCLRAPVCKRYWVSHGINNVTGYFASY